MGLIPTFGSGFSSREADTSGFSLQTGLLSTGIPLVGHLIHKSLARELGQPVPMLLLDMDDICCC